MEQLMTLVITFLKVYSLVYTATIIVLIALIASGNAKNFKFNLTGKACFEAALYITSIMAWFV